MAFRLERKDWWIAGGAGLGLLLLWKGPTIVTDPILAVGGAIKDEVTRGSQLTSSTLGDDGQIVEDPADLRAQIAAVVGRDVTQDAADLARMIRSEGAAEGRARAFVALNDAATHGWSLHFALTYSTNPAAKGRYGEQYTPASLAPGGVASSRRYSTKQDPFEGDLTVAEQAIADYAQGIDDSGGAVKFYDKDSGQAGARSYDDVVALWAKDGLEPFTLPGYPSTFVLFRQA